MGRVRQHNHRVLRAAAPVILFTMTAVAAPGLLLAGSGVALAAALAGLVGTTVALIWWVLRADRRAPSASALELEPSESIVCWSAFEREFWSYVRHTHSGNVDNE